MLAPFLPYLRRQTLSRRRVPYTGSPVVPGCSTLIESSQSSRIGFSCISASRVSRHNRVVAVESTSRIDFSYISACTSSQSSPSSRRRRVVKSY